MGFKDKLSQFKDKAKETAEKVKEVSAPTLELAKEKINTASELVAEKAESAKKAVVDKATEISPEGVEKVKVVSEKVKESTEKAITSVTATTEKAKTAVINRAEEISPDGVEKIREGSAKVKEKTAEMNILNSTVKKEALEDLKKANENYEQKYVDAVNFSIAFHDSKIKASELLKRIEEYINSIANSPKEIKKAVSDISVNRTAFDTLIDELEIENSKSVKISGGTASAGVLAGAGVAAFGPTAAMAIATTFGTASTGAAISSLTGAAATKAALAWLGGGALTAGGSGIAGGNALLAMAGPVGWIIGGAALTGSGLFLNNKNKKIAADAEEARKDIDKETEKLTEIIAELTAAQKQLDSFFSGLSESLNKMLAINNTDYTLFSVEDKYNLGSMVNTAKALSEFINKGLSTDE